MTKPKPTTGQKLRAARELRGWTQAQLAKAARVTNVQICRIERDYVSAHVGTLYKLAKALKIHLHDLV